MKKHFQYYLLLSLLLILAGGCGQRKVIPQQTDALEQFYYAMETYYFPASHAEGRERESLARKAANALKAVWEYFPQDDGTLVLMEAHFYQGMCFVALNESEKAAEAFYRCFSFEVPAAAIDDYEADMISYKDDAWHALIELREYLSAERLTNVDLYGPLP